MVSIKDKVDALGLKEVDTNPMVMADLYQVYQITKTEPHKRFKYYKEYNETFMYYSEEYLNKTPIDELLLKDICNDINLIGR